MRAHPSRSGENASSESPPCDDEAAAIDPRQLAEWLQPQEILLALPVRDREHALRLAAQAIARTRELQPEPVFDALWRREQAGTTALGNGFAIPHARIIGIPHPLTLYLRTESPVEFGAFDGKPVSDLLVILVPSDGSRVEHLQLLALVARLFSDKRFRRKLREGCDTAVVANAFRTGIKRVSAG